MGGGGWSNDAWSRRKTGSRIIGLRGLGVSAGAVIGSTTSRTIWNSNSTSTYVPSFLSISYEDSNERSSLLKTFTVPLSIRSMRDDGMSSLYIAW